MTRFFLPALILPLALSAVFSNAQAAPTFRYDYQNAAGLCQGALPQFAGTLRARPLAIGNEGANTAFVTCALQGASPVTGVTEEVLRGSTNVFIMVSNIGTASATVACTLVDGFQIGSGANATYTVKSVTLAPGQGSLIDWVAADISPAPSAIQYPSISCALPSNTLVNYTGRFYYEGIGN